MAVPVCSCDETGEWMLMESLLRYGWFEVSAVGVLGGAPHRGGTLAGHVSRPQSRTVVAQPAGSCGERFESIGAVWPYENATRSRRDRTIY